MKLFDKVRGWHEKVNFVDQNNVFVGYDMGQSCCEHADWFIADKICDSIADGDQNFDGLEDYVFDTSFLEHPNMKDIYEGNAVVFRLTNGEQEKFLHLFNCHNGYYGHGFDMSIGETVIQSGVL